MKESIAQMLKAEAVAKKTVASAEDKAAEIVRKARAEAAAIQDEARHAAQAKAAKLIEEGAEQARAKRTARLAEIDARNQQLRDVDPKKAEAARGRIVAALTGR